MVQPPKGGQEAKPSEAQRNWEGGGKQGARNRILRVRGWGPGREEARSGKRLLQRLRRASLGRTEGGPLLGRGRTWSVPVRSVF